MTRYFLFILNMNKLDLYIVGLEMYFYYFIHYINQKYFNIEKNVLDIKNLTIDQVMILSKSEMAEKRN